MKSLIFLLLLVALVNRGHAQIPVTDIASITNNRLAHAENIAKWVDSIAQLRTQIDQLNQQINIQDDIRKWSGNPTEAGANVLLDVLGEKDLGREFGRGRDEIIRATQSLESLKNTANGNYRSIQNADLNGQNLQHDALTFRRYSVLDAKQVNAEQVTDETKSRESELQEEIALTLQELKAASTEAETQKLSAKLTALNGQLSQVEAARRREVDEVALQKIANDTRIEEERVAAAELESKDNFLANQRVSAYMKTLKLRKAAQ
jgi:hypothetical protein